MDIATVSNTDLKKNDKKCVPKNLMSAKVLCDVRNTKLLFGESLEQGFMEFFFLIFEKFNYCHSLKAQLFSAQG